MIKLYGITRNIFQEKIGESFKAEERRELVATFSDQKSLDDFLGRRLLKNPIEEWGFEPGQKFKQACDMGIYNDYEVVEEAPEPEIPHDPW